MGDKLESEMLAEEIMNKAIQEVVFKYTAYAQIISSFRIVYSDMVQTIGVDRYARLVANPEFVVKNQAYLKGIIVHEVLHIFFGHTTDTRSKLAYTEDMQHNKIANIAEDCAINQFIDENLPDGAITPNALYKMTGQTDIRRNESAEYYYDLIMESIKDKKKNKGGEGEGEGDGDGDGMSNGMCSTDEVNTGKVQDELDRKGIEHISQEEVNERVLATAQEICKSQGRQYGQLVNFAKEMLDPKVDWRPLLQATIRNAEKKVWTIHARQTYKRVSRRSGQILLPKKNGQKVSVVLTFDTSGSISQDMVNQFLAEVQSCMRYSEIKECALWHTSNYWYGTPAELNKDIEKIFESGGTDEACMGNAEHHCKADLYIHFSDGYHGENFGFEHPQKNIEILWDGKEIKGIRKEF
jgi:predicted metal-dependent peptidase